MQPIIGAMKASGRWAWLPTSVRADAAELLDSGELDQAEVEANLADLVRLNRLPGGTDASLQAAGRLGGLSLLDVGAGAGDMPLAFAGRGWRTTAVEPNPQVLRVLRAAVADEPLVDVVAAEASSLPFDDGSFDVVHSSLLLHHLDPDAAVGALVEMRRVARRGVVSNDLRRGAWPFVATAATVLALGRSRVTRADGIASARRAHSLDELAAFHAAAGLRPTWRSNRWMPRVAIASVPA